MRALLVLSLIVAPLACQGPLGGAEAPRIICHNSNCVEPADPDADDTLEALAESLALEDDAGRPLLDGVEVDTFWHGAEARCLFAHDLGLEARVDAAEAARVVLAHLRQRRAAGQPLTRRPGAFALFIELKGHVGESKTDKHSPEQRALHAACALDVARVLAGPAEDEGFDLQIFFTSFDPVLLRDLTAALDATRDLASGRVAVTLGAIRGPQPPLDPQTVPIEEFADNPRIGLADVHPHWLRQADLEAYDSLGWELGFWMFSSVPETYARIDAYRPRWLATSEAQTLVRWLER